MMLAFTLKCKDGELLKSVTMLLSIFWNVMVVIATMAKITEAITTQRQTQDILAGQATRVHTSYI